MTLSLPESLWVPSSSLARSDQAAMAVAWADVFAWEYGADERFRTSDAFWRMMGYDPAAMGPMTVEEFAAFVHPDDRGGDAAEFWAAVGAPAGVYDREARYRRADGRYVWLRMRGGHVPPGDSGASALGSGCLFGMVQGIESRKRAEARLREQQREFETILRASRVGTWSMTPSESTEPDRVEFDAVAAELLGYARDTLNGAYFFSTTLVVGEDRRAVKAYLAELASSTGGGGLRMCEFRTRDGDGRESWFLLCGKCVDTEGRGRPARVVGVLQEITYRKTAEEANKRRDRLLNAVNEVAQLMLAADGGDFRPAVWQALDVLGRASEVDRVYLWQNHRDAQTGELLSTQLEEWSLGAAPQQGNEYTVAVPFEHVAADWIEYFNVNRCVNSRVRDLPESQQVHLGAQSIVSILVAPIWHEGTFWGFIGFDDCHRERTWSQAEEGLLKAAGILLGAAIARQKTNEELQDALVRTHDFARRAEAAIHAKNDFLARISEEIRALTGEVTQAVRQLDADGLSDIQREYLDLLHGRSRSMERLVNHLSDYSQLESDQLTLRHEPFRIDRAVEVAMEEYTRVAQEKGLAFTIQLDRNVPARLVGDMGRVEQLLEVLLDNAVKFTESGEVVVQVVSTPLADGRASVRLAVMDTGPGLSPAMAAAFSLPLEEGRIAPVRTGEGTGFGLAIFKHLVALMGGTTGVVGELGAGATFWARIPFEVAPATEEDVLAFPSVGGCALVVQANVNVTEALRMALGRFGVSAETVETEEEAFEALTAWPGHYAWVFLDAAFHGERADGLLRRLSTGAAKELTPPFILTLPQSQSDHAVGFSRMGYAAVFFLPGTLGQLKDILVLG